MTPSPPTAPAPPAAPGPPSASASHPPDPVWATGPRVCLACGYELGGLADAGPCPECGVRYDRDALMLAGVPHAGGRSGPAWRKAVWIGLAVLTFMLASTWTVLIMLSLHWLLLVVGAGLACGLAFMAATSRRERSGVERLVFTRAGVARAPMKFEPGHRHDTLFIEYPGEPVLEFKRVGPFWYVLTLSERGPDGRAGARVLKAGVRCPDAQAPFVMAMVRWLVRRGRDESGESSPPPVPPAAAAPPVAPPLAPSGARVGWSSEPGAGTSPSLPQSPVG